MAQLRIQTEGPRGKASFARKLGISASTYDYYEADREPPPSLLVRIADLSGVDLRWLLTGESGPTAVRTDHPAVKRAAELLEGHPEAAAPLAAFVELLAASMHFPAKLGEQGNALSPQPPAAKAMPILESTHKTQLEAADGQRKTVASVADGDRAPWIPVLGRTAAGIPQFWDDPAAAKGLTTMADAIDRHVRQSRVASMVTQEATGQAHDVVQVITLTQPDDDNVAEFISAPVVKTRHGQAFAVRVDGDSMAPDIRHGELVILDPTAVAQDGKPAVVQLQGQIGVTCKLYRRLGQTVHLVPVNEQYPPQAFAAGNVLWALRVLAKVSR